jgi:lysophospholipase L1-like esterase
MTGGQRRGAQALLGSLPATRLGVALVVLAIAAATIAPRELFSLTAEDSDRSVRRFRLGPANVLVLPRAPWAQVPAWLPGPADQWAGGSSHAIVLSLDPPPPRALVLDIRTGRTKSFAFSSFPAPPVNSRGQLRIVVNGKNVTTVEIMAAGSPPRGAARPSRRVHVAIPASVLDRGAPLTMAVVNDGSVGVGLERIRLAEALPSFSVSHLRLDGRFPAVCGAVLAVGLAFLLRGRLEGPGGGGATRGWRRASGPALGLLILGLAVAAPAGMRALPRWAWLLLILSVLPLGRSLAPAATVRRGPALILARGLGSGLLALLALAVSLIAGELALRAVFGDEPWAQSALRVPPPRTRNGAHTNSLGFDEREFPLEKPPDVYRIAILGDSLSVSAPRAQRFGSVIADRLSLHPPGRVTYEALNFALTGIDTEEETEILRQSVWRAHPDFVLLEWYVNDLENGDYSERPQASYPMSAETGLGGWLYRLTDRTLLRWMLREEYESAQQQLGFVETYPAYMHRLFGEPASPRWGIAADALRSFIAECRAHRTPVAIALFPHLSAGLSAGTYEFAELHDQVLDLCHQEGVPCIDLRSTFAAYRDYGRLWVHRFDAHPNALAHRLAGERLVEVLGPLWLDAGRALGGGGHPEAPVSRAVAPGSAASRFRRS